MIDSVIREAVIEARRGMLIIAVEVASLIPISTLTERCKSSSLYSSQRESTDIKELTTPGVMATSRGRSVK
jgi:hypothetical protein